MLREHRREHACDNVPKSSRRPPGTAHCALGAAGCSAPILTCRFADESGLGLVQARSLLQLPGPVENHMMRVLIVSLG
jgi:hypothetical protein